MNKLSPQKELIVSTLRDLKWHCGREWLNRIKDDRIRISELNRTYMKEKGFEIIGEACKGRFCGVKDCPLYARRAQKMSLEGEQSLPIGNGGGAHAIASPPKEYQEQARKMVALFDAGKSSQEIFSIA